MNKVFKVIWSEARNAYVVVSEMAKSHGTKSCSTKKLLAMLIATGVMTCASMAPAMAANLAPTETKIEIGTDASASGEGSVAIGQNAAASGLVGIAIGRDAEASGTDSIAIGGDTKATKIYSVAIGNDIHYIGESATAVGQQAHATGKNSTAIGTMTNVDADWNVAQLKAATENAGWNLSTGKEITNPTKVKSGAIVDFSGDDENITVSKEETDFATLVNVKLNRNLNVDSINAGDFFMNNDKGIGYGGEAYVTRDGLNANDKVITNVAAGVADTDAVNVGQLKNSAWKLAANGVLAEAEDVKAGDYVDFNGDQNVSVSKDAKDGVKTVKVELNKDLTGIETISNGDAKLTLGGFTTELTNGQGASVKLFGDTTTINNAVTVYKDGRIAGVAAGINDNDAVNVGQLKAVGATANMGWNLATNGVATEATNVKPGDFVDFSGDKNISVSHDGTKVKVELNKDIDVNYVQTNALNSKYNLSVGTMAENGIMPFFVNSTGAFYAAHNKFSVDKDGNMNANSVQTNALNAKYNLSVGTMAENGIMPFFVNSTGAFYAANNKFSVDKDGKVTAPEAEFDKLTAKEGVVGGVVLNNGAFYKNSALRDGELFIGDNDGNYSQITPKSAKLGKVTIDKDGKISGVAAGAVTADSTDAVNGSQLHAVATEAGKHSKVVGGNNINVEETDVDGQKFYKVNMNKDIILGDLTGKYVNISGTNGTIETTGYIATQDRVYADKGAKLADIDVTGNKISNGASSIVLDGSNVKVNDKVTIDQNGKISGVAAGEISSTSTDAINGSQLHQTNEKVNALDNRVTKNEQDIAKNKADIATNKADIATNKADIATNKANIAQNAADIKKVEALAKKHTTVKDVGKNITVTEGTNDDGGKEYTVALKPDISLDSVTTGDTVMNNDGLKVGDKVSVTKDAVTAGQTSISNDGVKVNGKTYVSDKGLNANDQKVTNVAAGEISATSKDAVNGSQLYATNQEVANNTNRINKLGSRVNKVGAGAAALAALHPMDFDPDDKLTFSAGYGNYAGENAAAIGAYYRPDEKVMFSVAGTVGNGENMVNAGVSFALDRTNHVSNSRTALAREVIDLRGQLAVMGAKMAKMEKAFGMLDETKTKLFPDVPANHWAYEYIAKLAGNGYIEGYPDGNFGGDRLMTRYEFAAMLYRAIENGAALEEKIIKEFEPELGRIRVDRISGEDGDRDKIERVRVNDTKGERDHYGNKLAK